MFTVLFTIVTKFLKVNRNKIAIFFSITRCFILKTPFA